MADNNQTFTCNYPKCGKTFTRKFDWGRHLDMHLGNMYHCDYCNKGFTRPGGLKNHSKICKWAKYAKPQKEDGMVLDATPVKPVTMKFGKTADCPPANLLERTAWIATDKCTATQRAIQILSKNNTSFDPTPPSFTDSAARMNRKLSSETREDKPSTSTLAIANAPSDIGPQDTPTTSNPIMAESAPAKKLKVTFNMGKSLLPPPHKPRMEGFKRRLTSDEQPVPSLQKRVCVSEQVMVTTHNRYKVDIISDLPPRPSPTLSSRPLRELRDTPIIFPWESDVASPDPRRSPAADQLKCVTTHKPTPRPQSSDQIAKPKPAFVTEPENSVTFWKDLLKQEDPLVSPIESPPSAPAIQHTDAVSTKTPPNLENSDSNSSVMRLIGNISPDSHTSEPAASTSASMEPSLDICPTTNALIIDIIHQLSMINERSMVCNLGAHKKPLNKILKKLTQITKKL